MHRPVHVVEVRIWGRTVGAVALDPKLGYYAFEYDRRFTASGIELAPLTMPLVAAREPFVFTDLPEPSFRRLPGSWLMPCPTTSVMPSSTPGWHATG